MQIDEIYHGNCMNIMPKMEDNSVHRTSSITIYVEVFVEAPHSHVEELATTAKLTYVALDERTRRPMPIFEPGKEKSEEN